MLLFLGGTLLTTAQEAYRKSLSGIKKIQLETDTSVSVEVGSSNGLVIKSGCKGCDDEHSHEVHSHEEDQKQKDRSKGLTAIYAAGEDNTGYGFQVEQEGDFLRIKDLKSFIQRSGFTVVIPASMNLNLDCGNLGSATIAGVSSEIEVNTNVGNITMNNVTGPVVAHSNTGTVEVVFSKVNQNAPISITSSVGIVDVSLPANTNANVELKSTMGTVYSNFDLEKPREDGLKVVGANRSIKGKLNNGGVNISLKSSTGAIYLRKK